MLLNRNSSNLIAGAFLTVTLTFALTSCAPGEPSQEISDDSPSIDVAEDIGETEAPQPDGDSSQSEEDATPEVQPPTQNQFEQTIKNLRYQYEPTQGADVYFPAAGGQLPEDAAVTLQLVFVDYDDYFLQLRVLKAPTGDFDIQSLGITAEDESIDFEFSDSQLYDAYIYDELTYEIGEYPLSLEEETFFLSLLGSDEVNFVFEGASESVESEFDRLTILGIGTVLRFKQGLDAGYEIPDGLAQPLM